MMPLFFTSIAFIAGICLARALPLPAWIWALAAALAVGLNWLLKKKHWFERFINWSKSYLFVSPSLLFILLFVGGLRYSIDQKNWTPADLAWYNERGTYELVAVVDQSPDIRDSYTNLHVAVREIYDPASMTFTRISGSALIRLQGRPNYQLGDLLRMSATPRTPSSSGSFSYKDYLEHQGIFSIIYSPTSIQVMQKEQASKFDLWLEQVRHTAAKTIYALYPQPESGLLEGILLGNDNNLPVATANAYRDTGTAHIIAISGFNMAILAALFSAFFTKLTNRYWSLPLTAIVLMVYALLVGASPSVMRAAIMAIIAFGGRLVGRKDGALNALGLTAGIMCLISPHLPWDVSFQLSFMATLGLVLFASPLQEWLKNLLTRRVSEGAANRISGPVSEYFLFTLAAQVTTLPVILLQFSQLSLTSLIANPLVLPVQPALLVGSLAATLMGMVWLPLGRIAATITWPLSAYSNWAVTVIDRIHGGSMTLSPQSVIYASILLGILLLLFIFRSHLPKWFNQQHWGWIALSLFVLVVLLWTSVWRSPDGKLHIQLLNTGEETSIYLRSPSGKSILIDPSSQSNTLSAEISPSLPLWRFHLDEVLATQLSTAKAISGLNERLPVDRVLLLPAAYLISQDESAAQIPATVETLKLSEDEKIDVEPGLQILPVASDLDHTALLIEHGQVKILIPGGTDPAQLMVEKEGILANLDLLILSDVDLENLPADMWQNLEAKTILWNSASLSPDPAWLGLDEQARIEIISDGNTLSIAK
jgi:competence protein ComEC